MESDLLLSSIKRLGETRDKRMSDKGSDSDSHSESAMTSGLKLEFDLRKKKSSF